MKARFLFIILMLLIGQIKSQTLYVVYSTNLNGYLEPCECPATFLGGMTRVLTAIKQLRIAHPDLLLVDSGDFFKSYTLPAANWLMLEMMHSARLDAVSLGEQELVEGSDFLVRGIQHFPLSIVSCNLKIDHQEKIYSFSPVILEKTNHKIGIIGLVEPDCFEDTFYKNIVLTPIEQVLPEILSSLRPQVDLLIVVYHAAFEQAVKLAEDYPSIDVIIAGHSQETAQKQIGRQIVLQNGYDGEYLGILKIDFHENGFRFTHESLPIDDSFQEDLYFREKIRQAFPHMGESPQGK